MGRVLRERRGRGKLLGGYSVVSVGFLKVGWRHAIKRGLLGCSGASRMNLRKMDSNTRPGLLLRTIFHLLVSHL